MIQEFENSDGGVVNYDILTGMSDVKQPYRETGLPIEDLSFAEGNDNAKEDFYDADGDDYYDADGDEFYDAEGDADDYSNAGGFFARMKERRDDKHQAKMEKKSAKTDIKKARAEKKIATGEAKKTKADAKVGLADAQKLAAEAASKGTTADIAMASALSTKPEEKGISKGAIIGIVVGAVVILGVVGFFMYKKSQANKLNIGK
jgi:hypothetical protein